MAGPFVGGGGRVRLSPLAAARSGGKVDAFPSGPQFPTTAGSARRGVGADGLAQGEQASAATPNTNALKQSARSGDANSADLLRAGAYVAGGVGGAIVGQQLARAVGNRGKTTGAGPLAPGFGSKGLPTVSGSRSVTPYAQTLDWETVDSVAGRQPVIEGQFQEVLPAPRTALPAPAPRELTARPLSSMQTLEQNGFGAAEIERLRQSGKLAEVLSMIRRAKR